jgi:iron complex outermembrane receptor protein
VKRVGFSRADMLQAAVCVSAIAVAMVTAPATTLAQLGVVDAQVAQGELRTFDIPPQPLSTALVVFGQQAGRQVTADGALLRGVTTPGVRGAMTVEQALRQLLIGTGLTYSGVGGATISLQRIGQSGVDPNTLQLDPVQVQGAFSVPPQAMIDNLPPPYAGGQVAKGGQLGLLGNRDVMDTPFNQTSYTAKKAQDQQAKTVRDVLIDDPSVRFFVPDGGVGSDQAYIRGFNIQSLNTTYGGLYGMLPSGTIMAELAERIEILKGPNAMLTGMPPASSIGGTINIVPKRAPNEDLTQVTANYLSAGQFGGHADVARRFGPDKQFGARFNGAFRAGQTSIDNNSDRRGLGVLGLDFRGDHVRLAADLGYQHQYVGGVIPYLGLNAGVPLPWAPDARKAFGQPWGFLQRKDLFGVIRAELDMTERVTAFASFGAHDSRYESLYSQTLTATNGNGAAMASGPMNYSEYNTYLTAEAGVRGFVDTGPIGHELALVATTYSSVQGSGAVTQPAFTSNLYTPTFVARPSIPTPAANKASTQGLGTVALADTLSAADKRIQLTVGARWQQVTAVNFNTTTGVRTSSYDQTALSPAVALVFKPWENVSFYGNYIQGLQAGTTVGPAFANAGEVFPPFKSTQYEAGVKVDWGRFTSTASLFQITRPFTFANVASNTLVLGGEQRNQGLELNLFGEPIEGVRLLGGIMLLNAVLTKTQGGLNDGWYAPFTPGFNLNLAGEWDLPFLRGLTLTGRAVYTAAQYIDTTWPRRMLPDWTRFDIGARYAFENPGAKGRLLVARFNIDNVLDADYWAGGSAVTTLSLGAPRTFRLSLTADF